MNTIRKAQLAVIHAASDDETRYNLNSVQLRKDGAVVATNGHMMAMIQGEETHERERLLPIEDAKQLQKALPKGVPIPITYTGDKGNMHVTVKGGELTPGVIDAEYVNTDQITKKLPLDGGSHHVRIALNIHYIERLAKIVRAWSETTAKDAQMVEFRIPLDLKLDVEAEGNAITVGEHLDPIHVLGVDAKNGAPDLHVVLMPMRLESYEVAADRKKRREQHEARKAKADAKAERAEKKRIKKAAEA